MTTSDPLDATMLKITDAFVGYRDNVLTLGECHDTIENLITAYHLQKCRSYLPEKLTIPQLTKNTTVQEQRDFGHNKAIEAITKRIEGDK